MSKEIVNSLPIEDTFNKHHESDIKYVLQVCRWALKPIGIWTFIYGHATRLQKAVAILTIIFCFFCQFIILVPIIIHVIYRETENDERMKCLSPITFAVSSIMKFFFLSIKGRHVGRCIELIESDWKRANIASYREIMLKHATIGRHLPMGWAVFLYVGGVAYSSVGLVVKKQVGNTTVRTLGFPGHDMFFDVEKSPNFEIVFMYQLFCIFVMYNALAAAIGLAAIFGTHACGQIQIQMARLRSLVDSLKIGMPQDEDLLGLIFKDHVKILHFTEKVDRTLQEIFTVEIVTSTGVLCLVEYDLLLEWNNNNMAGVVIYMNTFLFLLFQIFIYCYIGELIHEQGEKIGEVTYGIEWYKLPPHKARCLILLIAIANYPPKFTVGKIITLNLTTFAAVVKASLGYLNLMRAVTVV